VRVAIAVSHRVAWGERVAVVGGDHHLGAWALEHGLQLAWSVGDVWRGDVRLPPGLHEFKVQGAVERGGALVAVVVGCRGRAAPRRMGGGQAWRTHARTHASRRGKSRARLPTDPAPPPPMRACLPPLLPRSA
jgi:hypothetical protein